MKLELKDLEGYPKGLDGIKVWSKDNLQVCTIVSMNYNDNTLTLDCMNQPVVKVEDIEPYLRPLSDLTDSKVKQLFDGRYSSHKCMMYDGTLNVNTEDIDSINLIYYISRIEKLYENHFDVSTLIDANLAIDINTTDVNATS